MLLHPVSRHTCSRLQPHDILEEYTVFQPPLDRPLSPLVQLWLYLSTPCQTLSMGRQRAVDTCLSPLVQLWLYVSMSRGHSLATGVYVCLRASTRSLNCSDFFQSTCSM